MYLEKWRNVSCIFAFIKRRFISMSCLFVHSYLVWYSKVINSQWWDKFNLACDSSRLHVPFHILPQLQIWLSITKTWFHTLYNWVLLIKHKNVYSSPQHKCSIALSSRSQTMLMMAWMLDLSADQWRINEFSLRETFDNNPILSVTKRPPLDIHKAGSEVKTRNGFIIRW